MMAGWSVTNLYPFGEHKFKVHLICFSAVCDNNEYTHIRRLNTCIKRNTTRVPFEEARADCQNDGADLMMVKTSAVLTYLKYILISVTGNVLV